MRRTPWPRLLLTAGVTAVLAWAGLAFAESRGASVLPLPWVSGLVVLLIAGFVGALGWNVRQYTKGDRPDLDAITAARTVVLATASAYTGALLSGWYLGHLLLALPDLAIDSRRDLALSAVVTAGCAVVLAVVGLVVERWCEVSEDDDEDPPGGDAATSGSTA